LFRAVAGGVVATTWFKNGAVAQTLVEDGTAAIPGFGFSQDTDCGLYRAAADAIGIAAGGVLGLQVSYGGLVCQVSCSNGNASNPGITFLADNNKGFYSPGANLIGMCIGGQVMAQLRPASEGAMQVTDYGGTLQIVGYRNIPQNSQSANYTAVLADSGKHLLHPSGGGAGDTFTIPANASVAYELGTAITFVNRDSNALSIAITSDTLIMAGGTSTGTRQLAQNGVATAIKVESTTWVISGSGLS